MKKSVLFLVQNLPVPQDRRIMMEARALKDSGYAVSIISPRKPKQKKFEILEGIYIFRYLMAPKSLGYLNYLWEYFYSFTLTFYLTWKIFLTRGFSVIHSANPPDFFFLIALFFKPFGIKFVYDQHDLMPEMLLCRFGKTKDHWLYKILLFMERMNYRLSDIHLATCQSGQEKTLSRVKVVAKNFIVRSAPDPTQISPELIDPELTKKVQAKYRYLCSYLGVMGPQDGVDKLLRSIRVIVHESKRTDIGYVLMGDGDDFDRLVKMAKDYKIEDNVISTGWADAKTISTYFYASQIGLMPEPKNDYTDNSLHNKILEYMSAGLPVVSYDLKEARVTAGNASLYVKNNNEKEFAKTIIELIDNSTLRQAMTTESKKRAGNYLFTQASSQKELLRAYNSLFLIKSLDKI
ncbi:MAG: glycosyltransferase family 4 protein [Candidatus Moranbacteria bacterium]|nr:glycosyltransferase family 4 protein [Candidatus Moranbacteria bacterium]